MLKNIKEKELNQSFSEQPKYMQMLESEMTSVSSFGDHSNSQKLEGKDLVSQAEESFAHLRLRLKAGRGIY